MFRIYMFEFSVSKDMEKKKKTKTKQNNDRRRIPSYLLTLIIKEVKISIEQDKMVTKLNIIQQ